MFCALDSTLRRQRRRLVIFAAVLALAGAVVTVHSATTHDHLGDVVVMCVAVAETAVVAAGAALVLGALLSRPLWTLAEPHGPELAFIPVPAGAPARRSATAAGLPAVSSSA